MEKQILLVILTLLMIVGCAIPEKGLKEKTLDDLYLILSEEEYDKIEKCEDDDEIKNLIESFWESKKIEDVKNNDSSYFDFAQRLKVANERYPDRKGWGRSDRKRIYLMYGEPAYIEKREFVDEFITEFSVIRSLEIWYYMQPRESIIMSSGGDGFYTGEMKFMFADMIGYGEYKQIYSTEDASEMDARLYERIHNSMD